VTELVAQVAKQSVMLLAVKAVLTQRYPEGVSPAEARQP